MTDVYYTPVAAGNSLEDQTITSQVSKP